MTLGSNQNLCEVAFKKQVLNVLTPVPIHYLSDGTDIRAYLFYKTFSFNKYAKRLRASVFILS